MDNVLADPELDSWISGIRAVPAQVPPLDIPALRTPRIRPPGPDLLAVRSLTVPGNIPVAVRLYRPGEGRLPVVVHVHGGGFVFGDLESHDRTCRRLAQEANAVVLAVDHRRAPEHCAPAAVDDVARVLEWVLSQPGELGAVDGRTGLAGDSAGGLLAIVTANRLVSAGALLRALLLICPNADLTLSQPSIVQKSSRWGLDEAELRWFVEQWVPGLDAAKLSRFSPLQMNFGPLPRTLIATAEHDPLRHEGAALARKLQASGIDAREVAHPGLVHGFLSLDTVSPAAAAAGAALLRLFGAVLREP
ncbi:alpha/beta hydrolase [Paenarthrobacter sp. Z7-10]|nr:alpha/beta hydrolase [Paenarthrobacter sp. Z7-10]